MDYGLAVLAAYVAGGETVATYLPPWHQTQQSDDDILAVLRRVAKPKEN